MFSRGVLRKKLSEETLFGTYILIDYLQEKKFSQENGFGETFSHSPSTREVYFPFGGTYNLFCFIEKEFPIK